MKENSSGDLVDGALCANSTYCCCKMYKEIDVLSACTINARKVSVSPTQGTDTSREVLVGPSSLLLPPVCVCVRTHALACVGVVVRGVSAFSVSVFIL